MTATILIGNCMERMAELPENSVDAIVTDPPYHLTSIVKRFGKEGAAPCKEGATGAYARASKGFMGQQWDGGDIAFQPELWAEAMRVLKPGGHLVAFSGTRTYHRMACAIEDAGFEIRDQIQWLYASGFPKSHNLDGEWKGWGTALKPANEPICLARKPISEKNIAANVLKWGTGALNIDGCRIETSDTGERSGGRRPSTHEGYQRPNATMFQDKADWSLPPEGRWPANICHDGSDEVLAGFPDSDGQQGDLRGHASNRPTKTCFGDMGPALDHRARGDSGSAARFFYCAKASREERGEGNNHPTVKPVALMQWLIKLVTPKGGLVLDPFMGSGSTGVAADGLGHDFIGIDLSPEYAAIAESRIRNAAGMFADVRAA